MTFYMKNAASFKRTFLRQTSKKAGLPHDLSSLIRLASYRIPCFFHAFLCFLCDTEKFAFLRSAQSIIPQTARKTGLCGVKYDALRPQLAAIHRKIPCPVSFLNIDCNSQCLSKLPGGQYHIFIVLTAKVIDPTGQGQGGVQQRHRLTDIGDAPEILDRKADRFSPLCRTQKVQRQVAPDGQP